MRNEAQWAGQVDPVGGMRASWNRRVSRDMERIFGARPGERLDGPAGPPPARTPDVVIPLVGEAAESWPRTLIVTSVAAMAGVLLLSGAVWMMRGGAPAAPPTAKAAAAVAAAPRPSVRPPVAPAPDPTPALTAMPRPAVVTAPASPAPQKAVAAAPSRPKRAEPPKARERKAPDTAASARSCKGLEDKALARCMYPQVLVADQRLRDAFGAAASAGMDVKTLRDYRKRWSRLSKRADSDPRRVVVGYRELASQLNTARAGL